MEPGLRDREHALAQPHHYRSALSPQWSPVLETGNTRLRPTTRSPRATSPQWSPVLETGNTLILPQFKIGERGRNGARS